MHFTSAIATAVIAALPVVHGSPILDTRQNGVTCQNSSGSPKTEDVTAVINQLKGQGGSCPNTNGKASDCTTLVKAGSAAISICGGKNDDGSETSCADVADFADQIQQTCLSGGLVGGTYTISPATRVEVIH